jgi:hypothetical protein
MRKRKPSSSWNSTGFGRSSTFHQFLYEQTPERRAELLAQERAYLRSQEITGRVGVAVRDFAQSMVGVDAT